MTEYNLLRRQHTRGLVDAAQMAAVGASTFADFIAGYGSIDAWKHVIHGPPSPFVVGWRSQRETGLRRARALNRRIFDTYGPTPSPCGSACACNELPAIERGILRQPASLVRFWALCGKRENV
jgi:hypothetical protein